LKTQPKIIAQEENGKIQLYKHGVFWTAYEQSAYCIWKEKGYKVSCKFVKYMKRNIVSLGFPDSALKIWQDRNKTALLKETENYRLFLASASFDEQHFLHWRQNIETERRNKIEEESLEKMLKDYPLEKKTPVEAFLFLQKLQENILEIKI
jgi:hypothetical protein